MSRLLGETTLDKLLCQRRITESGCWEWTAAHHDQGYGLMHFEGRMQRVSRIAYSIFVEPVPDELDVCHTCDNPPCFYPAHLFAATHQENLLDMAAKGRQWQQRYPHLRMRGMQNGRCRLTDAQVDELRRRFDAGGVTKTALANEYGIGRTQVGRLIRMESRA